MPRLSSASIATHTVIFAPEEMPSTKAPRWGCGKRFAADTPDRDSAPPKISADRMRGSRIFMMIWLCVKPILAAEQNPPYIRRG